MGVMNCLLRWVLGEVTIPTARKKHPKIAPAELERSNIFPQQLQEARHEKSTMVQAKV
jgi:hypothetical protein